MMKKTMISALSMLLVSGISTVGFAAANPFADVPADHWAYDAVSQLAKDGVLEGYGDDTFRGEHSITRYEMAQMVAKAMAREDRASAADKAAIDKLAAEFSDELNNLGVRVANLEKKTDNVRFTGEARYTYSSSRHQDKAKTNVNETLLRLEPSAVINEHWTAKARIDYTIDMDKSSNSTSATVDRAWVEGKYNNFQVNLGKIPYFSRADHGMILDTSMSGAQVTFGKSLQTTLTAARYNQDQSEFATTGDYRSIEVNYDNGGKFTAGAAYHFLGNSKLYHYYSTVNDDAAKIWQVGMGWRFTPTASIYTTYSHDTAGHTLSELRRAWSIEADYKQVVPANKGSFGAYVAYRSLGDIAVIKPTYDGISVGQKGWELGLQYVPLKNILAKAVYFTGKDIEADTNASKLFGRLEFFF